ncbi:MAG: hypothetical protein ACKVYV_06360 [Limisphaerales bacterium]
MVLLTWILFITWAIVFSIIVPLFLDAASGGDAWNWVPESIAVGPALFLGWAYGLIAAVIAPLLRALLQLVGVSVEVSPQRRRTVAWCPFVGLAVVVVVLIGWLHLWAAVDLRRELNAEVKLADGQTFQRRAERSARPRNWYDYEVRFVVRPSDASANQLVWAGAVPVQASRLPLLVLETNGCAVINLLAGSRMPWGVPRLAVFAPERGWRLHDAEQLTDLINRSDVWRSQESGKSKAQLSGIWAINVRPPVIRVELRDDGQRKQEAVLRMDCNHPAGLSVIGIEAVQ